MEWDEIWELIERVFPEGMTEFQFRLVVEAVDVILTELMRP